MLGNKVLGVVLSVLTFRICDSRKIFVDSDLQESPVVENSSDIDSLAEYEDETEDQGRGFDSSWILGLVDKLPATKMLNLTEILEKVKIMILRRIKANAAVAVKARGDMGWMSSGGGGHGGLHDKLPTLEIALLTLAFLTFAVFVVNLIQQLLARMSLMVSTGSLLGVGRRRRSVSGDSLQTNMDSEEYWTLTRRVLESIENPTVQIGV